MTLNPPVATRLVLVFPAPTRLTLPQHVDRGINRPVAGGQRYRPPPAAFTCWMALLIFSISATLTFSAQLVAHGKISIATAQQRLGQFDLDGRKNEKRFMGVIHQVKDFGLTGVTSCFVPSGQLGVVILAYSFLPGLTQAVSPGFFTRI